MMTRTSDEVLEALNEVLCSVGVEPSYRADGGLSMSALGGCRRQGAYLWAQTEKDHEVDDGGRAAEMGTALHLVLLPEMAELLGGDFEVETVLFLDNDEIPGTVDLHVPGVVIDLKTVGRSSFDFLTQPRTKWKHQVTAGAMALMADTCMVLVLDRDTGRSKVFQWQTSDMVDEVVEWIDEATRTDVENVPRDHRGPGIDKECDWCPFTSRCWPDQPVGEPQSVLIHDDEGTRSMLHDYLAASEREQNAKADKAFARSCLTGSEPGQYGEYVLGWRRSGGRESLDATEAKRLLAEAGLPVPVRQGEPSTTISVKVIS